MTLKARRFDLSPDNFLAGIGSGLKADELGLYWLICLKIYSAGGPVHYDEKDLATTLNRTDIRVIKRASERLQFLGKIAVTDGQVSAKGCATPLQDAANRVATAVQNGRKGGRPSNKNKELVKPGGFIDEKLTSTTTTTSNESPISPRGEIGRQGATLVLFPEPAKVEKAKSKAELDLAALYQRGRELLGKSSGGVITNLLKLYDGKTHKALAKLEDAAAMREPERWLNAFLWSNPEGWGKNIEVGPM